MWFMYLALRRSQRNPECTFGETLTTTLLSNVNIPVTFALCCCCTFICATLPIMLLYSNPMTRSKVNLSTAWLTHLDDQFKKPYMRELSVFLRGEKAIGKRIYPAGEDIFAALNTTPLDQVRVVILGQDPYHGPGQAHGLSFSVPVGQAIPPSLLNIYKELGTDLGLPKPAHGNLASWAKQGVLLLNSVLTVEAGRAASHQGKGWEQFTDAVVSVINHYAAPSVFLLWGAYAQKKGFAIDQDKHLVLCSTHPSPFSAYRGFLGCRHFSRANQWLEERGRGQIDWQIP